MQHTTRGADFSGFVVLHGTLAHVPPPEWWLSLLLSLLHQRQRNPLHDGGRGVNEDAEEAMVGDGFNFGGVFAQQRQQWR